MSATAIIKHYEQILTLTGQMVDAARAAQWNQLVELELHCRAATDVLLSADQQSLSEDQRQRKIAIIQAVLENDAEIRNLVQPELARLQHLIGATKNEKRLARAYLPDTF